MCSMTFEACLLEITTRVNINLVTGGLVGIAKQTTEIHKLLIPNFYFYFFGNPSIQRQAGRMKRLLRKQFRRVGNSKRKSLTWQTGVCWRNGIVDQEAPSSWGKIGVAAVVGRSADSCWVTAVVTDETKVEISSADKDGWLTIGAGDAIVVAAGDVDGNESAPWEIAERDIPREVRERRAGRAATGWPCTEFCGPVGVATRFERRMGGILGNKTWKGRNILITNYQKQQNLAWCRIKAYYEIVKFPNGMN